MKRIVILALAVLMLCSLFCACSATGNIDPYGGYSNVSTTRDGRVNGTNDRYYNGSSYGYANGGNANGYSSYYGGNGANGYGYGSGAANGMTGYADGYTGSGMNGTAASGSSTSAAR